MQGVQNISIGDRSKQFLKANLGLESKTEGLRRILEIYSSILFNSGMHYYTPSNLYLNIPSKGEFIAFQCKLLHCWIDFGVRKHFQMCS